MVALAASAPLLGAGLRKGVAPAHAASVLRRLGLPRAAAVRAVRLLAAAELAVGLGLVVRPGAAWVAAGVAGLGGVFALAGLVALRRAGSIPCACFGGSGGGRLGRAQILALPLWLGTAAALWIGSPPPRSARGAAGSLATVGIVLASVRAFALTRSWRAAREDRLSARRSLIWLRR